MWIVSREIVTRIGLVGLMNMKQDVVLKTTCAADREGWGPADEVGPPGGGGRISGSPGSALLWASPCKVGTRWVCDACAAWVMRHTL